MLTIHYYNLTLLQTFSDQCTKKKNKGLSVEKKTKLLSFTNGITKLL